MSFTINQIKFAKKEQKKEMYMNKFIDPQKYIE